MYSTSINKKGLFVYFRNLRNVETGKKGIGWVFFSKKTCSNSIFILMSGPEAIMWPDLDVDLEIDSLRHPERYPLVIKRNPLDYIG